MYVSILPNEKSDGFGGVGFVLAVLVVAVIAFAGWGVLVKGKDAKSAAKTTQSTTKPIAGTTAGAAAKRDKQRKADAIRFATNLTLVHLVQKRPVAQSQAGFESFETLGAQKPIADPLTAKAYTYNADQAATVPGEITFRVNAVCDDKISGSHKTGLIIDGSAGSVAVAIKLESGSYACESNL